MRKRNSDVTHRLSVKLLQQVLSSINLIIKEDKSLLFDLRFTDLLQVCYQVVAILLTWNQIPGSVTSIYLVLKQSFSNHVVPNLVKRKFNSQKNLKTFSTFTQVTV